MDFIDARRTVQDLIQQHAQQLDKKEESTVDSANKAFDLSF